MQEALNSVFARRVLEAAGVVVLAILGVAVAAHIPQTITIFALAALIAFGVAPVTRDLERRMPRRVAIALVYTTLTLCLAIVIILVIPATIAQLQSIAESTPVLAQQLQDLAQALSHRLQGRLGPSYALGVEQMRGMLVSRLDTWTALVLASLGAIVVQAVTALFVLVSALVLSAFFVSRAEAVGEGFRRLFPAKRQYLAIEFENELARVFGGFVAGQVTLCIVTALAVWLVLTILGAPFAILVGVATGLAYAVPFVGMIVVQVAAALLALPEGWPMVIRVTIAIFAIARIVDAVLVPKIMSESVGVSPIAIMFAVFAGGELFGVVGLAMGIPAAALIKTLWNIVVLARADDKLNLPE